MPRNRPGLWCSDSKASAWWPTLESSLCCHHNSLSSGRTWTGWKQNQGTLNKKTCCTKTPLDLNPTSYLGIVNFWVRPASRGSFCTFPGKGQGASGQAEDQTTARSLWSLSRHGLRPSKVDGQSTGMSLAWDRFLCMPGLLQLQLLELLFFLRLTSHHFAQKKGRGLVFCSDRATFKTLFGNSLCRNTTPTCTPTTRVVFGFSHICLDDQ